MSTARWEHWLPRWRAAASACEAKGGEVSALRVAPPATEHEVSRVEARLGLRLPESFRTVLRGFSRSVEVAWSLPDDLAPPAPFDDIFSGQCEWNLDQLEKIEAGRRGWVQHCFGNPADPYDAVWHHKHGLAAVANGDVVAFDLGLGGTGEAVVYLSHDDGEGHGRVMGSDFIRFVDQHSKLGCVGLEDWQWLPFCDDPATGICGDGAAAIAWRTWFRLDLPG